MGDTKYDLLSVQKELKMVEMFGDPSRALCVLYSFGNIVRAGVPADFLSSFQDVKESVRGNIDLLVSCGDRSVWWDLFCKDIGAVKDNIWHFLLRRDRAELVFRVAKEFSGGSALRIRSIVDRWADILEKFDINVLLDEGIFATMRLCSQELIKDARYFDKDFFWWLPATRLGCQLPAHRVEKMFELYSHGRCHEFGIHLFECDECFEIFGADKRPHPADR